MTVGVVVVQTAYRMCHSERSEESGTRIDSRSRFLASLGMTMGKSEDMGFMV